MAGKLRKYLSYAVLAGFLGCVTMVILAKILVTPERVRSTLVPVVEKYLHCKVNLQSIDVSLYSGVSLTGLELLSRDNKGMLLAADKVAMRYQFWPLFEQRIVIDEISLERPQLNIERFADGKINLQQLASEQEGVHNSKELSADDASGVDIVITKIFVNQGEILLKDYSFAAVPHRYKISDLGLNISDFSLSNDCEIKLWGKINGDPVDVDGIVNLKDLNYDVQVNVSHLDMVQFQPYYRQVINGHLNSLKLNIEGRVWGNDTQINSKARVDLEQLDMTVTPSSRYPLRAAKIGFAYAISYDRLVDALDVGNLAIDVDDIAIMCQGSIKNVLTSPDVGVQVTSRKLPLRSLMSLLPPELGRSVASYDFAGTLGLKMALHGGVNAGMSILSSATLSLDGVQASIADMRPALSGVVEINGKNLHSQQLNLTVGDNHVNLEVLSNNWAAKKPEFRLQLKGDKFTTAGLAGRSADLAQLDKMDAPPGGGSHLLVAHETIEPQPLKLPFNIGGDVVIKQARIDSFDLTDLRFHYELKDDLLSYDHLSGQIAKGSFNASGQIDLSRQGFTYSGQVEMRKIDLSILLPQIDPEYANSMSGSLATRFSYAGAGTLWLRMQQNLSASGDFDIADGQMSSNAMLKELAVVLGLSELTVFSFTEGSGKFELATGGHVQYAAEFNGSKAKLVPVGAWNIDGTLKSDLDVYLSPKVRDKLFDNIKITQYIQDKNGWGFVPLMLSGKLASPHVQINLAKVKDRAIQRGVEQFGVKINKKLGGDSNNVAPEIQLIESTLKGLLAK